MNNFKNKNFLHDGMKEFQNLFDGRRTANAIEKHRKHYDAKFVVRIKCEIYPNWPRYILNLADNGLSIHNPRVGEGIPPSPEWKGRDYIKNILPKENLH